MWVNALICNEDLIERWGYRCFMMHINYNSALGLFFYVIIEKSVL